MSWLTFGTRLRRPQTVPDVESRTVVIDLSDTEDYGEGWRAEPVGPGCFRVPPDPENPWPLGP